MRERQKGKEDKRKKGARIQEPGSRSKEQGSRSQASGFRIKNKGRKKAESRKQEV